MLAVLISVKLRKVGDVSLLPSVALLLANAD